MQKKQSIQIGRIHFLIYTQMVNGLLDLQGLFLLI